MPTPRASLPPSSPRRPARARAFLYLSKTKKKKRRAENDAALEQARSTNARLVDAASAALHDAAGADLTALRDIFSGETPLAARFQASKHEWGVVVHVTGISFLSGVFFGEPVVPGPCAVLCVVFCAVWFWLIFCFVRIIRFCFVIFHDTSLVPGRFCLSCM